MIRAIIFDCFGVLTTDTWKEFVATLPPEQLQQARDLNKAYGAAHVSKAEFQSAIRDLTSKLPKDIDEMLDSKVVKNTELLEYISGLRKSYKIGLLSNVGTNWIRDQFLSPDEQKLFDVFLFSYEVHMTKPDPGIFTLAAERLGVPISDCVLIDDVEHYCAIAAGLGMQSVVYQDFRQMKTDLEKLLADSES